MIALGRLDGHRSGRIPVGDQFGIDMQAAQVGERAPISPEKLTRRLDQVADLTVNCTGLLPANVLAPHFISRLRDEAPVLLQQEQAVWDHLAGQPDYVALCHWNANVDNAWFWRDSDDELHCGLMDWGCAGQMNVAMALWGAMSGAETDLWDYHLDELLGVFIDEVGRCGGPTLDVPKLRRQVLLYVGIMTVAWLLDIPALIGKRFGGAAAALTRKDAPIKDDDSVRAPLQMLTNALNLWDTHRFGELLP